MAEVTVRNVVKHYGTVQVTMALRIAPRARLPAVDRGGAVTYICYM